MVVAVVHLVDDVFEAWIFPEDKHEASKVDEGTCRASPRRLARGTDVPSTGRQLAVHGDGADAAIYLVDVDNGFVRKLAADGRFQAWSPDGERFMFTAGRNGDLHVINADGTGDRIVARGFSFAASWSPDGTRVAVAGEGVLLCDLETGGELQLSSEPQFVIDLDWSPDGDRLALGAVPGGIWELRRDGSGLRRLTKGDWDSGASWSPDGRLIAYTHSDKPGFEPRSIYVMRPNGSGVRRLTDGFNDMGPSWSPDGNWIAFERQLIQHRGQPPEARHYHINIVEVATGKVTSVETPGGRGRFPSWRPA